MLRKEDRDKCHSARDIFFACVEKAGGKEDCGPEKIDFEKKCPPSWVHHFVLQRQVYAAPPPKGVEGPL
jgi:hypothetical protein